MKISVRSEGKRVFALLLPNFLCLTPDLVHRSRHTEQILPEQWKTAIDSQAARRLIKELGRIRKKHGRFTLVDVDCKNGDTVKIEI